MPKRIQRKRAKGWRMPEGAVYVGRRTIFGNPWKADEDYSAEMIVDYYRLWLLGWHNSTGDPPKPTAEQIASLRGKDLVCWCSLDQPCHADVLMEIANVPEANR